MEIRRLSSDELPVRFSYENRCSPIEFRDLESKFDNEVSRIVSNFRFIGVFTSAISILYRNSDIEEWKPSDCNGKPHNWDTKIVTGCRNHGVKVERTFEPIAVIRGSYEEYLVDVVLGQEFCLSFCENSSQSIDGLKMSLVALLPELYQRARVEHIYGFGVISDLKQPQFSPAIIKGSKSRIDSKFRPLVSDPAQIGWKKETVRIEHAKSVVKCVEALSQLILKHQT